MSYANPNRHRAYLTDRHYQQRDQRLDGYAAAMMFDPVKTPEESLIEREAVQHLEQHIDRLPPRVGLAVRCRYGIRCEPMLLDQIGEKFGVSKSRVSQIVAKGERLLRYRMANPRLLKKLIERDDRAQWEKKRAENEARKVERETAYTQYTAAPIRETPTFDARANYRRMLIQYGLGGFLPRAEQHE